MSECAVRTSISARTLGESMPLRQNRLIGARASAGGKECTLNNFASGKVVSTLRGISEMPMPATAQPSMA
jgi:hypothetical protein